jgi:nicotinate-nucleotide pyrophosphorylase (carboxylating)
MNWPNYINRQTLDTFINQALAEDVGTGDYTSLASIPEGSQGKAQLIFKSKGIVAGIELSKYIFKSIDDTLVLEYKISDGMSVDFGMIGLTVEGNIHAILKAERLVLNCMQRMSGIATTTQEFVKAVAHTHAKILDTRKTTPNFRLAEKWAVAIGGGTNHRYGLYDMILLKDNHIDYAGGVKKALQNAKKYVSANQLSLDIEIEVRTLAELQEALEEGGMVRIMLDNMSNSIMSEAVKICSKAVPLEASGGVNLNTVAGIANTGVDYISVGSLTHSISSLDISLKAINK